MPDDLVTELRDAADYDFDSDGTLLTRAADEIERLRRENHALQLRIQDGWKRIEDLEEELADEREQTKGWVGDA